MTITITGFEEVAKETEILVNDLAKRMDAFSITSICLTASISVAKDSQKISFGDFVETVKNIWENIDADIKYKKKLDEGVKE